MNMFDMLVHQRVLHPRCVTFVTSCGVVIMNLPVGGSPNTNCKCLVSQYTVTSHHCGGVSYQLKLAVEDYELPCPKTSVLTCMLSIIVMIINMEDNHSGLLQILFLSFHGCFFVFSSCWSSSGFVGEVSFFVVSMGPSPPPKALYRITIHSPRPLWPARCRWINCQHLTHRMERPLGKSVGSWCRIHGNAIGSLKINSKKLEHNKFVLAPAKKTGLCLGLAILFCFPLFWDSTFVFFLGKLFNCFGGRGNQY